MILLSSVYFFYVSGEQPPQSCWIWKDSDVKLADTYEHWVLYQGDIISGKSTAFVKRGVMPDYVEGHELTLLFRLYTIPPVEFLASQIRYTIEQWALHGVSIKAIQLDYDSLSAELDYYADYISALKRMLPSLSISITGLASWYDDNLIDLKKLGAEVEYIAFQLYQNYAPLDGAEQYARRLVGYPFPYKIGITLHNGFSSYRFEEGPHYIGKIVFINSRK